jgi:hypothetical protein
VTAKIVVGQLKDVSSIELQALPHYTEPALADMLDRVLQRMDRPGASISGFNGASGLSCDTGASGPDTAAVSH